MRRVQGVGEWLPAAFVVLLALSPSGLCLRAPLAHHRGRITTRASLTQQAVTRRSDAARVTHDQKGDPSQQQQRRPTRDHEHAARLGGGFRRSAGRSRFGWSRFGLSLPFGQFAKRAPAAQGRERGGWRGAGHREDGAGTQREKRSARHAASIPSAGHTACACPDRRMSGRCHLNNARSGWSSAAPSTRSRR